MIGKVLTALGFAMPAVGYSTSDKIAAAAAVLAALALMFSILTHWHSRKANRTAITVDLWTAWISKDYRAYRVDAARAIISKKPKGTETKPSIAVLLEDRLTEESVGSIEHFVDEASKLMDAGLLDRQLFSSLFRRSMEDWWALLDGFDRGDGSESFTDAELARAFRILLGRNAGPTDAGRFLPEPFPYRPEIRRKHLLLRRLRIRRGKMERSNLE